MYINFCGSPYDILVNDEIYNVLYLKVLIVYNLDPNDMCIYI